MTQEELLWLLKELKRNTFTYIHQQPSEIGGNVDVWKGVNKKLAEIIILLNDNGIELT